MEDNTVYILFVFAILLHNFEEALWYPSWSKKVLNRRKPIGQQEFLFAVLMITVLAVFATSAFIMFPHYNITKYVYFGFLLSMILNVIVPHLIATIIFRKYTPGLITGLALIIPINGFIIYRALSFKTINSIELIISTIVVGGILLICIPLFFKLSKLIKNYN